MTTMAKCAFSVLLVSVLGFPVVGSAASPSAADLVRGGIDAYKRGDYQAATKAFEEAVAKLPDDPRIAFNRAATLAAQNDAKGAEDLLREVATSPDPGLAALAYYDLACIAARGQLDFWNGS